MQVPKSVQTNLCFFSELTKSKDFLPVCFEISWQLLPAFVILHSLLCQVQLENPHRTNSGFIPEVNRTSWRIPKCDSSFIWPVWFNSESTLFFGSTQTWFSWIIYIPIAILISFASITVVLSWQTLDNLCCSVASVRPELLFYLEHIYDIIYFVMGLYG